MKQEWLEKVQDVLIILLNHLLVFAAIITFFDMFQVDGVIVAVCLFSLVIPFGYYYITHRPQKLIPPPLFIILLEIFSIMEKIMKTNDWQIYYLLIAFVYLAGYFLCYFFNQYIKFLLVNRNSASNIPEKSMLQSGIKQTLVFGSVSTVVLLLSVNFDWVKRIADQIWNWVLQLLGYIFSGIETFPPLEEVPMEDINQATSEIGNAVDREMFPIFVQEVVKTIVTGAVILAFVGGCILILLLIYEFAKMYLTPQNRRMNQKEVRENEDIREYCGIEKNVVKKTPVFLFFNNRERIRKIYFKKVLKHKKELVGQRTQQQLEYMTARECCNRLSEHNLKEVYEKARYSAEDISAEDVRLARTGK